MKLINYLKDPSWINVLKDEFEKEYFLELEQTLTQAYEEETVYPPKEDIFTALNLTPFSKVKVVIIGQDPYHGPNQAHGLSFSVSEHLQRTRIRLRHHSTERWLPRSLGEAWSITFK
jgi:uracil-DNA glycosylase